METHFQAVWKRAYNREIVLSSSERRDFQNAPHPTFLGSPQVPQDKFRPWLLVEVETTDGRRVLMAISRESSSCRPAAEDSRELIDGHVAHHRHEHKCLISKCGAVNVLEKNAKQVKARYPFKSKEIFLRMNDSKTCRSEDTDFLYSICNYVSASMRRFLEIRDIRFATNPINDMMSRRHRNG